MKTFNNEHGFIFPLCLLLSFLLIATTLHQIERLHSERLFLDERINYFTHDTHFQMSTIEILSILSQLDTIDDMDGILTYDTGHVFFTVESDEHMRATISLTSSTPLAGERSILFQYDHAKKLVTQWSEGM